MCCRVYSASIPLTPQTVVDGQQLEFPNFAPEEDDGEDVSGFSALYSSVDFRDGCGWIIVVGE